MEQKTGCIPLLIVLISRIGPRLGTGNRRSRKE
jgi:hypothetical protein